MQVCISTTNRVVRQMGERLGDLPGCQLEQIDDATVTLLRPLLAQSNGGVVLSVDHQSATTLPIPDLDPTTLAAQQEYQAASTDFSTNYQTAMGRLDAIIADTTLPVPVRDLARIQKRILRFMSVRSQ